MLSVFYIVIYAQWERRSLRLTDSGHSILSILRALKRRAL